MTYTRLKRILKGYIKSWTANTGLVLAGLGYLQTQGDLLTQWFGPSGSGNVMMITGLFVVLLRAKTKESLEIKGMPK